MVVEKNVRRARCKTRPIIHKYCDRLTHEYQCLVALACYCLWLRLWWLWSVAGCCWLLSLAWSKLKAPQLTRKQALYLEGHLYCALCSFFSGLAGFPSALVNLSLESQESAPERVDNDNRRINEIETEAMT